MICPPLPTGQTFCADATGATIPCRGTGQDAEFFARRAPGPERFTANQDTATDTLTGLTWLRDANAPGFPLSWQEGHDFIGAMNRRGHAGHRDWRMPDRRELFSLVCFDQANPALSAGHPFINVFDGWYWSATPSAMHPSQAWHVQLSGGRMFWGSRTGYEMVWPVRGASQALPKTGAGDTVNVPWPEPRLARQGSVVRDALTGLTWTASADLANGPTDWTTALAALARLNRDKVGDIVQWRLPTIRELESLVDASRHSPALPAGHPFDRPSEAYWSSTSSAFERDWAMCLYLHKGAVGVAHKGDRGFHVWAVSAPV
ncbi:DUF1566 domain-containing protein [Pseudodesulfovibrio sp. F-1]|uniref:DUF1566 domain-containing protein n=1 Tax=Pseudodesulfovibrio alkaliphilus TaxID=2661613 RepID=A0A7K1KRQ9_9BACT|nr:DUF1566 domain-containing protein [Pseudodesulfovibrio alkaliphilus]MUM78767.1 DUF1566 domain-containing protein [Pseudodesulfovibrio alkaliphilus]